MTPEHGEILSAFVDGVAVGPEQLAEALADPDALALLVTCARVRADIRDDVRRPSPAFYERMHAVLRPRRIRRFFSARVVSLPWPIAAGAAAVLLITGLGTGLWVHGGPGPRVPPPMTIVAPTTPGPAPPATPAPIAQASQPAVPPSARMGSPRPTSVLRFERPSEWRESLSVWEEMR